MGKNKGGTMKAKQQAEAKAAQREEEKSEDKGFPECTLPQETQDAFLKYVKAYLPKATPENVFENQKEKTLKFDYFLTSYRIALMWAHTEFAKEKAEFAVKRRALADMKSDDPQVRGLMLLMCGKM